VGKPLGFMFFSSMESGAYQNAHVEVFLQIAGQLAMIVEKGRLYQQLLELNEIKNRFLAMAAHDLRSPIGVIRGYLDLFIGGYMTGIPEEHKVIMSTMRKACDGMLVLIDDLIDISVIEAGRLELNLQEVDLAGYLETYHTTGKALAGSKSIQIGLDLEPDLPKIRIDVNRIGQVLNNLLSNAIKFSHPGTSITIQARKRDDQVEVSVIDQGQGIPEAELSRIFTDFSRTSVKPTGGEKSTGLGLAISRRIVEAHGGTIRVESKVGRGSEFTFKLPRNGQLEPEPHAPSDRE